MERNHEIAVLEFQKYKNADNGNKSVSWVLTLDKKCLWPGSYRLCASEGFLDVH